MQSVRFHYRPWYKKRPNNDNKFPDKNRTVHVILNVLKFFTLNRGMFPGNNAGGLIVFVLFVPIVRPLQSIVCARFSVVFQQTFLVTENQ